MEPMAAKFALKGYSPAFEVSRRTSGAASPKAPSDPSYRIRSPARANGSEAAVEPRLSQLYDIRESQVAIQILGHSRVVLPVTDYRQVEIMIPLKGNAVAPACLHGSLNLQFSVICHICCSSTEFQDYEFESFGREHMFFL